MSGAPSSNARSPRRGAVVGLLLVTGFFTAAALAHVWVRLQIVRVGYRISEETSREARLLQLHRKLEVERALLRNPTRLEREAKARLHLAQRCCPGLRARASGHQSLSDARPRPNARGESR